MQEPKFPKCYKVDSKPHKFCPGCGHPIVLKMLGQVIDEMSLEKRIIFLVDIGCSLLAWDFFDLPTSQTHHGRTVPTAVGFKMAAPDKTVIAYMGDGGGYAIGLQHTISSAQRGDPLTTIVVNNTLYGMTGGQSAPTTCPGEITTTTPAGSRVSPFLGPETLARIAPPGSFICRGSTNKPLVLKEYLKKALQAQIGGHYSFVEALSVCPLNWHTDAKETIERIQELEKVFKVGVFI
jgi:2-oxoglutarate ferredoxin oxidoreductase subunit beta